MASNRLLERKLQEGPILGTSATKLDFCKHKYSLLILIGRTGRSDQAGNLRKEIERGIRSWDVDLTSCDLNLYLQEFLSHHTVSFKGAGQRCLRYSNKVLETHVLISPPQEQVHTEVRGLLGSDSAHKLLVLAGQSVEDSGELLLPRGLFSPHQLEHILADLLAGVENAGSPPAPELTLTLSCPSAGQWETVLPGPGGGGALSLRVTVNVNPPEVLPAMEAVGAFAGLVQGSLGPAAASPFEQLPPPSTVGFLKLSRPCCYVFPGGGGDCAFFAVCGFTVLADGGSDAAACFWRLVRHLDRVDALLLTHAGAGNLPGVNALLERKVAEREVAADVRGGRVKMTDDLSKKLISPELGVVFFNVPSHLQKTEQPPCTDAVLRAADQAALTARLLQELEMAPQPLVRPRTVPVEPLTLFQKMGVGQLDLYVLSPESGPDAAPPASACVLLVWRPACPQEKVVRVLFPGVTPQERILEGLEGLRGLAFMRRPTVTVGELEEGLAGDGPTGSAAVGREAVRKEAPPALRKEKQGRDEAKDKEKGANEGKRGSDRTKVKDALKQKAAPSDKNGTKKGNRREVKKDEKVVKRDESGPKRREQVRRDGLSNKLKNESNTKPKKEAKNDSRTLGKKAGKPSEKEKKTDSNVNAKKAHMGAEPPLKALPKSDKERAHVNGCEKEQQNEKTKSEESPCGSKMSTPEDMTADFLRLKEEAEREEGQVESLDKGKEKGSGLGSLGKDPDVPDIPGEQTVGAAEVTQGNIRQEKTQAEDTMDADPEIRVAPAAGDHTMAEKPPKVVGFPSPFKRPSESECEDQQDRTPTEYTLLDGALRNSPPSRLSLETQGPASPDEETVEPDSPDSRPNSAGHTPYCLSPNDVWCPRGIMGNLLETPEDVLPPGGPGLSDGQPPRDPRNAPDGRTTSNAREKHSFLSLGSLKEGGHDPSPSVATTTTTTTTHSMPAEVSSPQSTEVDESLSMSFEQGPTTVSQREGEDGMHRSHSNGGHFVDPDFRVGISVKKPLRPTGQGPETGRPPGPPNALHFEAAAHDVDLCLVSPCEFKHFKLPDSEPPRDALAPQHHGNSNASSNNLRDVSASESNAPLCTEDCPSTTADGALDSDDEKSCSEPSHSLHDHPANHCLPTDPLPAPPRDGPPLPPQPDSCMPVPRSDSEGKKMGTNATGKRGKRPPGATEASHRPGSGGPTQAGKGRPQNGGVKGPSKDNRSASRNSSSSSRTTTQTTSLSGPGAKSGCCGDLGVYVDLAYLPSGASCPTVDVAFFRSVRSACYIISGDSPQREQLMRRTLDALLQAKASWPDPIQVTLIPTFESVPMQEWYQQTMDKQRELDITVLGSNSTVAMQDETFPACKIEF